MVFIISLPTSLVSEGVAPQGIIWNPVQIRDSACCCNSLNISLMHSLPLELEGPGRRMGRDKSEDLPVTNRSLVLAGLQGRDFGGYPNR